MTVRAGEPGEAELAEWLQKPVRKVLRKRGVGEAEIEEILLEVGVLMPSYALVSDEPERERWLSGETTRLRTVLKRIGRMGRAGRWVHGDSLAAYVEHHLRSEPAVQVRNET